MHGVISLVKITYKRCFLSKNFFLQIKLKALLLIILYLIGTAVIIATYVYHFETDILSHSLLFALILMINRFSYEFQLSKEKMITYIHITELCFIVFLFFVFINSDTHFKVYKLLIIPSLLVSITQVFGLKKAKE